jgi:hypothetical protein
MMAIFLVDTLSTLLLIVFLSSTTCRQLNVLGDDLCAISVTNEEMYVIIGCYVIENVHPIPLHMEIPFHLRRWNGLPRALPSKSQSIQPWRSLANFSRNSYLSQRCVMCQA